MARQVLDEFLTKKQDGSRRLLTLDDATVNAYERGATASSTSSGTTVAVFGLGSIGAGDIVEVNGSTATVQSVASDGLSFVHDNSNLSWARLDRFLNTSQPAVLTEDPEGTSVLTQPVTASDDGRITVYISTSMPVDLKIVDNDGITQIKPDWGAVVGGVPTFRPEDYGSVTVASNVAISAAVTAASAAGGGIVQLDRRTYPLAAAVEWLPGVWIRGVGQGQSILKVNDATAINGIQRLATGAGAFGLITDLTIDGNDALQSSGTGLGMNIRNVSNLRVENVEVKNCRGQGISVVANDVAIDSIWIEGCYVHDVCSESTNLGAISMGGSFNTTNVFIRGNRVHNAGDGDATGNTGTGILVSGTGTSKRFTITDNIVTSCQASGITLQDNSEDSTITDNYIYDVAKGTGGNGIHLAESGKSVIKGNTIDTMGASADPAIEITGDVTVTNTDVLIEGNRITGFPTTGIWVGTVDRCSARGNIIKSTTASAGGIDFNNNSSPAVDLHSFSIEGNSIELSSGGNGIEVQGWVEGTILGNTVKGGTHGIFVDFEAVDAAKISIVGNVSTGNSADGIRVIATGGTAAQRVTIGDNACYLNTQRGLTVSIAKGITINGNVLEANGRSGLALDTVDDIVVLGNIIKNNGTANVSAHKEGIQLAGTIDALLIDENLILDHTAGGNSGGQGIGGVGTVVLTNVVIGNSNVFLGNQTDVENSPVVIGLNTVASTAALALTAGRYFQVSGTADITSVTGGWAGRTVTLQFTGTAASVVGGGLVKGSNLSGLKQSLTYLPGDQITITFDGSAWQENGRSEVDAIPALVSAATITLPASLTRRVISVTGATGPIATINGGWVGRVVSFVFASNPTITRSASLLLQAGGNYATAAGSTLTLVGVSTGWQELQRGTGT